MRKCIHRRIYCSFTAAVGRTEGLIFWKYLYQLTARLFLFLTLEYERQYMWWPNLIFHARHGSNEEIRDALNIYLYKGEINFFSVHRLHIYLWHIRLDQRNIIITQIISFSIEIEIQNRIFLLQLLAIISLQKYITILRVKHHDTAIYTAKQFARRDNLTSISFAGTVWRRGRGRRSSAGSDVRAGRAAPGPNAQRFSTRVGLHTSRGYW